MNAQKAQKIPGAALKDFYVAEAAFKSRLIENLTQAGFLVQSVRHTGEVHVVQVITPIHLLNPAAFMDWQKRQKKGGPAGESAAGEAGKTPERKA